MTLILSNIKDCELLLFFPQALLASNYGYMITISNDEEKIIHILRIRKLDTLKFLFTCIEGLDLQGPVDHELGSRPGGQGRGEISEVGVGEGLSGEEDG